MIKIKHITAKNFLSIGNQTQAVNLESDQLTLVLGENLDLGGDSGGSRNGVGKTAILNALSYAIYGAALTNIKKDNLINKINNKHMLVSVTFEKDGVTYQIERGRKPNFLKFSINGQEHADQHQDESQGDSRETQKYIEQIMGMSHDMFKHLVALNTYTEPFLSLRANDQRAVIEQLLGITKLSEKADLLKEKLKQTKDEIARENTRIETIRSSNEKIQQSISSLERKQKMWQNTHRDSIAELKAGIRTLAEIDIDQEINNQRALAEWNRQRQDIAALNKSIAVETTMLEKEQKVLSKLEKQLVSLSSHRCHSCGQELHDSKHSELVKQATQQAEECRSSISVHQQTLLELNQGLEEIGDAGPQPKVNYNSYDEALDHRNTLDTLVNTLENKQKESNPYDEQIQELKQNAFQEISWDRINELTELKNHQDFLLKLLTNKDSFIRKRIIDQNLSFLNQRLTYYLAKIGLPHVVEFQNDLSVTITQLGQDLDFDNLSRGERNRLILSLSWAFRDVWESLYHPINLLFIDELVDSGFDRSGVENSLSILKKMVRDRGKTVFLISHRDDLASRVDQILRVVKENGFTNYSNERELG